MLDNFAPLRELTDLDALLAIARADLVAALCATTQDRQAGQTMLRDSLRRLDERISGWAAQTLCDDLRGVTRTQAVELAALVDGGNDAVK